MEDTFVTKTKVQSKDKKKWHSEFRRSIENRKDPRSNPTRWSVGIWDPASLRDYGFFGSNNYQTH